MKIIMAKNLEAVHTHTHTHTHTEYLKNKKGITIISLVITIIILLILAGITINAITGNNGLFARAKQAKNNTLTSQNAENVAIADYESKIDEIVDGSRDTVTISKDEYEILKNNNSYSTTEKEVGTWIDGSKMYKVTIQYNMPFNGRNWYYFNLGLSKYNIKKLIKSEFYGGDLTTLNFLVTTISEDNLAVFLSTNDSIAAKYVTLVYTKNE